MRHRIYQRLAAFWLTVVLVLPMGLPGRSSAGACFCGQKSGCFCMMTMSHAAGGHCHTPRSGRDHCAMRSSHRPAGAVLPVVFDLRGWLQAQPCDGIDLAREPAVASVMAGDIRAPRFCSQAPEAPPPRSSQAA
jgi:hypothetical protein